MRDNRVHLYRVVVYDNKLDIHDVMIPVHILELRTKDPTWFLVKGGNRIPQTTPFLCSKLFGGCAPIICCLLVSPVLSIELNGKEQQRRRKNTIFNQSTEVSHHTTRNRIKNRTNCESDNGKIQLYQNPRKGSMDFRIT